MIRSWSAPLALAAVLLPVQASAQPGCTQEVLNVRGTPVTIAYCINGVVHSNGTDEIIVPVYATYVSRDGSFSQQRDFHFVSGERISRIVQNLRLERLGMAGVLHLTLAYTGGAVIVEGALLSPGGITVK